MKAEYYNGGSELIIPQHVSLNRLEKEWSGDNREMIRAYRNDRCNVLQFRTNEGKRNVMVTAYVADDDLAALAEHLLKMLPLKMLPKSVTVKSRHVNTGKTANGHAGNRS